MKRVIVIAGIVLGLGLSASLVFSLSASTKETDAQKITSAIRSDSSLSVATFAGGCFWCVEEAFEEVPGVVNVISGYTGGNKVSPTYRQVASGRTGHTEAVQIEYDDSIITYEGLLETLWRTADPTDNEGQYSDRGRQYRPEIFYHNEMQQLAAEHAKQALSDSGRYEDPIVIAISPATDFYPAEESHQDYYKKNPIRYRFYSRNSGRYQFIDSVWHDERSIDYANYRPVDATELTTAMKSESVNNAMDKETSVMPYDPDNFVMPTDSELKQRLSPMEYKVTQKEGTERPFSNALHDEKRTGLYVDVVSGEPLFSSTDKFDSGTGWPSFVQPISQGVVVEKDDRSLFGLRTEIRSVVANSHLGHVFSDGPAPTGQRYCMNSAAMKFIPLEKMAEAGYSAYIERVSGNPL